MRIRTFVLAALVVAGCSSDPGGTLMLQPDTHMVAVGSFTFVSALLVTGTGSADMMIVSASWSVDHDGIVMLSPQSNIQKVTGVAVGQVVVTASADGQTAQTGFTVVSP